MLAGIVQIHAGSADVGPCLTDIAPSGPLPECRSRIAATLWPERLPQRSLRQRASVVPSSPPASGEGRSSNLAHKICETGFADLRYAPWFGVPFFFKNGTSSVLELMSGVKAGAATCCESPQAPRLQSGKAILRFSSANSASRRFRLPGPLLSLRRACGFPDPCRAQARPSPCRWRLDDAGSCCARNRHPHCLNI